MLSLVKINQKRRYEILTQHHAESYVKGRFSHRPDIEETFINLQDPILRACFVCYIVLLGDDGVCSDIDTTSLIPIKDWLPSTYADKINLVLALITRSLMEGNGESGPLI